MEYLEISAFSMLSQHGSRCCCWKKRYGTRGHQVMHRAIIQLSSVVVRPLSKSCYHFFNSTFIKHFDKQECVPEKYVTVVKGSETMSHEDA